MKQVFRFDKETGRFIEPVLLEHVGENGNYELPEDCTEMALPVPNYRPVWNGDQWIETMSAVEISEKKCSIQLDNDEEIVEELALNFLELEPKCRTGLVAKEVADAGLDMYVVWSDDGKEIEGIDYDRLWTLLIPLVKEQRTKIIELEEQVEKSNDFMHFMYEKFGNRDKKKFATYIHENYQKK